VELNAEPAISALRIEQSLARAEQEAISDEELHDRLDDLRQRVDQAALGEAVDAARETTADEYVDKS
jgi:antitoxin ParD1/3/4